MLSKIEKSGEKPKERSKEWLVNTDLDCSFILSQVCFDFSSKKFVLNLLAHMPILESSNSAADKDMMSKI